MKFYKSPLSIWGLLLLVSGVLLNIRMFLISAWPTYLFFIFMGVGILFMIIDKPLRNTNRLSIKTKYWIQSMVVIIPLLFLYLKLNVIDARAEIIIAPKNYEGPYAIIYGIERFPSLQKEGRDIIARLPANGILLTSSISNKSILVEAYHETNDSTFLYGKRANTELNFSGNANSSNCETERVRYWIGYITNKPISEIAFDYNNYIKNICDSLCELGLMPRADATKGVR